MVWSLDSQPFSYNFSANFEPFDDHEEQAGVRKRLRIGPCALITGESTRKVGGGGRRCHNDFNRSRCRDNCPDIVKKGSSYHKTEMSGDAVALDCDENLDEK